MGVAAICSFGALILLVATLSWAANRLGHDTRDLAGSVGRLQLLRQALDQLHRDAGSTRSVLDDTGRAVGLSDRPVGGR